ncbi:MAG: hypothetical protein SwBeaMacB_26700 [Shewanella algae]|uniref:hypothetical protein n=1 Tax=Shewanella algae TaxID=38313 RepID=UPI0031F4B1D0
MTYREFIFLAAKIFGTPAKYKVLKSWQLWLGTKFNQKLKDTAELLPRYKVDNLFVSDKFKARFPDFQITGYEQGLREIFQERVFQEQSHRAANP